MADHDRKLSPAEFLAQLKAGGSRQGQQNAKSTRPFANTAPSNLKLDFSDLNSTAAAAAKISQVSPPAKSASSSSSTASLKSAVPQANGLPRANGAPRAGSASKSATTGTGKPLNISETARGTNVSQGGKSSLVSSEGEPARRLVESDAAASEAEAMPPNENNADVDPQGVNRDYLPRRSGPPAATPDVVRADFHLSALFDRVNMLLGGKEAEGETFRPLEPTSLEATRLTFEEVERLILKYLLSKGSASGRIISSQVRLPFHIVDPILKQLKQDQILAFRGAAEMGDYEFAITEYGRERARRFVDECTYFGAAPVSLQDYLKSMEAQSIAKQQATEVNLREAFKDLVISEKMLDRLGPAINSGRGMFLFGSPGNGKTSIAERVTRSFGSTIWIPRALGIDGDIIRLFDPGVHEVVEESSDEGLFNLSGVDQRWVHIVRPTVIAGGELTMQELEVTQNQQTKICEAPLQLKSNCGTLVIDDFGRQTMPVDVLLNRWIVPLEKRYDFLNLPSGKKIQVPFDQLIIFSTNLEPRDLVDGAFLRRIPYKIEVPDPTEAEFRKLIDIIAPKMGFQCDARSINHLIETHYKNANRPFRACHPRDLLLQVKNFCTYRQTPKRMTSEAFDFAVENYFSVM